MTRGGPGRDRATVRAPGAPRSADGVGTWERGRRSLGEWEADGGSRFSGYILCGDQHNLWLPLATIYKAEGESRGRWEVHMDGRVVATHTTLKAAKRDAERRTK